MEFAELLSALGRSPDDLICILERQHNKSGLKRLGFVRVGEAQAFVSGLAGDIYFSVNPLDPEKVTQLEPGQRGDSRSVASLTTLYADLDSKENGMGSEERCTAFVDRLSEVLGVEPVAVVHTGTGGMHPYWKLDQPITASTLRAWGVLVKKLAVEFGGRVDSVFDAARVLRVPGIVRANGELVRLELKTRGIVSAPNLTSLVAEYLQAEEHTTGSEFVPVDSWPTPGRTCAYVEQMANGWADDEPGDRHHWLLSQVTRLMASARLGCITLGDFETAKSALMERYAVLLNRPGSERELSPNEIGDIFKRAKQRVETSSEDELKINELGNHAHPEVKEPGSWQRKNMRELLRNPDARPKPALWEREDGIFLLYPGCTHSIHGESESGKSMLVQAEVANQLKRGSQVLYLDYEDSPYGVGERLELMGVTHEEMDNLYYLNPEQDYGSTAEDREAFEQLMSTTFSLAIIDGVTEAMLQAPAFNEKTGGGNDSAAAWQKHLPRKIAKSTGAAVVMIDHVAKSSNGSRFALGGQSKMAGLSGAAYVVTPIQPLGRDMVGSLRIEVAKDRPGYIRTHAVLPNKGELSADRLQTIAVATVDGTGDRISVRLEQPTGGSDVKELVTLDTLKNEICEVLSDAIEPMGVNELKKLVHRDKNKVGPALEQLTESEHVQMTPGPRNSKQYRLIKPWALDLTAASTTGLRPV